MIVPQLPRFGPFRHLRGVAAEETMLSAVPVTVIAVRARTGHGRYDLRPLTRAQTNADSPADDDFVGRVQDHVAGRAPSEGCLRDQGCRGGGGACGPFRPGQTAAAFGGRCVSLVRRAARAVHLTWSRARATTFGTVVDTGCCPTYRRWASMPPDRAQGADHAECTGPAFARLCERLQSGSPGCPHGAEAAAGTPQAG